MYRTIYNKLVLQTLIDIGENNDRNSCGHSYLGVRGKILGLSNDERRRKQLSGMFPLIKNEGWGFKDDLTLL